MVTVYILLEVLYDIVGIIKAYNKIYILDLSLFEQIFIKKTIKKFTLKIYDSIKIPNEL